MPDEKESDVWTVAGQMTVIEEPPHRRFRSPDFCESTGKIMQPPDDKPSSWLGRMYDAVPTRVVIALMCFWASWFSYMLRINLSLALVAMVYPTHAAQNGSDSSELSARADNCTEADCVSHSLLMLPDTGRNWMTRSPNLPDYGPRYEWSESVQGQLLAAYFYGSVLAHIPGGMLSEYFGSRIVVGVTSLVGAVFTMLSPLAAEFGFGYLIAVRFIIGVCGGPLYPSLHALVAQWGPPQEKSKFVWSLLGGTFGTVVTWPIGAAITEGLGWKASFYIMGGIVAVWTIVWFVLVYDAPAEHPRISPRELEYISASTAATISKEKRVMPFVSVATSVPFLALVVLHFGNLGGLFFLMTEGPKYMSEVLGFNLSASGALASLPYLMRLLFGMVFSSVGDYILSRPEANKTAVRKLFVIPSHLLPAALMAGMGYVGTDEVLAVSMLSLSLGCNGAATVSNLANHHDLAPNFAGSLYGIMNAIGTCTGFIFPALVGYILSGGNTLDEWRIIFFIGAGLYLASGVFFIFLGSAQTQPWNQKAEENTS